MPSISSLQYKSETSFCLCALIKMSKMKFNILPHVLRLLYSCIMFQIHKYLLGFCTFNIVIMHLNLKSRHTHYLQARYKYTKTTNPFTQFLYTLIIVNFFASVSITVVKRVIICTLMHVQSIKRQIKNQTTDLLCVQQLFVINNSTVKLKRQTH